MSAGPALESLIHRYLDGTITVEDMAPLNARLLADADARRAFAELLNLDSAIAAAAAGWLPEKSEPRVARRAPRRFIAFPTAAARWIAAAACVALLAGGGTWWLTTRRIFATVQKGAGVEELANGTVLHGETHAITAGTLELVTARGARIVIEAPAEFRFESSQRLRMMRGRLAADVPPSAKGFTVVTPSGDAVDLGTRFGVDVPANGPAEIHVFQGEVIAKASGAKARQSVRGGDAVTMNQGASAARELRSSAFIQPDEMPGLTAGLAAGQRARSETALAALRKDPALIALLDFESDESHPGVFRTAQGRWPGSRAPEFVSIGRSPQARCRRRPRLAATHARRMGAHRPARRAVSIAPAHRWLEQEQPRPGPLDAQPQHHHAPRAHRQHARPGLRRTRRLPRLALTRPARTGSLDSPGHGL